MNISSPTQSSVFSNTLKDTPEQIMDQALVLHQQGQPTEALHLYRQALVTFPHDPQLNYLAGVLLLELGDQQTALQYLEAVLQWVPSHVEALFQLGLLLLQLNQRESALQYILKLTVIAPNDPRGFINLAGIHLYQKDFTSAQMAAERAIALQPESAQAWNNFGNARQGLGDFVQAEQAFRHALQHAPKDARIMQNLADVLRMQNQLNAAEAYYRESLAIDPQLVGCWCNYGNLLGQMNREIEARAAYQRALTIEPEFPEAVVSLAGMLIEAGEEDLAIAQLRPIVDSGHATPEHTSVYAYALRVHGDLDTAQELLLQQMEEHPNHRTLIYAFSQLALTRKELLPKAIDLTREWIQSKGPYASVADRRALSILLAQLYDKAGQPRKAFASAAVAKRLKGERSQSHHDLALADALERSFTKVRLSNPPYGLSEEHRPIFIVGMPRSGTSFLEQMLAGHPAVRPCGEVGELQRITEELGGGNESTWPMRAVELDAYSLESLAFRYLHVLGPTVDGAVHITDKMPHNFVNVGFIHLLFPNARIIHIQRDPRDVAVSIYLHDFIGHHPYAHHIEDIARHLLFYRRCMQLWRNRMPEENFHELRYEDLVTSPEVHARALLNFLNLPWDEGVLRPESVRRAVLTSSRFQVQESIHRRAAGRWRAYQRELVPLTNILKSAFPEYGL